MTEYAKIDFIAENIDQGKLIREIAAYGQTGQTRLDTARILAARALVHFHKHGDATPLSVMQLAIPSHEREKAFSLWVRKHAPVKWDSGNKEKNVPPRYVKDKKSAIPLLMENEAAKAVIKAAIENPFDVFSKESAVANFSKNFPNTLRRVLDDAKKSAAGEGKFQAAGAKPLTPQEIRALNLVRDAVMILAAPQAIPENVVNDILETVEPETDVEEQAAA